MSLVEILFGVVVIVQIATFVGNVLVLRWAKDALFEDFAKRARVRQQTSAAKSVTGGPRTMPPGRPRVAAGSAREPVARGYS